MRTSRHLLSPILTVAIAAGSASPTTAQPTAAASSPRPPNIVLVLADDLGYGDIGVYGSTLVETPHIDALARAGVLFANGYVTHPVCSPSRAGLLTGRHQQRHGWEFNPRGRDLASGMRTDQRTIADELRARGYATGMVGKWHLGHERRYHPMSRGFDEYFGVLEGGSTFIDSRVPGVEFGSLQGEPAPTERPNKVLRGFEEVEVERYLTDAFTDEAVDFVRRHRDRPFFLYLSYTAPHVPLQATRVYLDRYRHIEDQRTRVYSAMVSSVDDGVGRLVDALAEIGHGDDTLVVFTSDNGCADYVLGACTNMPLRGYKAHHHEGGVHVPFLMKWPARLAAGTVYREPVSTLDLLATFTAAAGRAATTEDSVDLLPYLGGERAGAPHEYLYWRSGPTVAVRDRRGYKLIRYNRTEPRTEERSETGRLEVPEQGWKLESELGQLTMLYDLAHDPGETTNVAAQHPEVVARLERALAAWLPGLTEPILPPERSTTLELDGATVQLFF